MSPISVNPPFTPSMPPGCVSGDVGVNGWYAGSGAARTSCCLRELASRILSKLASLVLLNSVCEEYEIVSDLVCGETYWVEPLAP